MSQKNKTPSITLQTLGIAIQVIEKEISELNEIYKGGAATAEDDIWMYDLDRAALNLEEVYTYTIETEKIINFPKYDGLVSRKSNR